MAWNPRYVAYAKAHGAADPDEMLERDRETWPGGCMIGFSLWIQERWRVFAESLGVSRSCEHGCGGGRMHIHVHMMGPGGLKVGDDNDVDKAFDAWLTAHVGG